MALAAISAPEATDLKTEDVFAHGPLEDSSAYLGDAKRLDEIYNDQGYLFLRDVLDRGSVQQAADEMMDILRAHGIVSPDAGEPIWTGKSADGLSEEAAAFQGICSRLFA